MRHTCLLVFIVSLILFSVLFLGIVSQVMAYGLFKLLTFTRGLISNSAKQKISC